MSILGNPITLGAGGSVSQDTSGNIIIPPAQDETEMISFTYFVPGVILEFQCPYGFKWQDFIGSEFDTYHEFGINGINQVQDMDEGGIIFYFPRTQHYFPVGADDIIINGQNYYCYYYNE